MPVRPNADRYLYGLPEGQAEACPVRIALIPSPGPLPTLNSKTSLDKPTEVAYAVAQVPLSASLPSRGYSH